MKDLKNFLSEEEKDTKKPHTTQENEFPDDKRYVLMMEEYKRMRRTDREEANKLLAKAMKLKVSPNAKIAGAYI
jgi:hypothetical protein